MEFKILEEIRKKVPKRQVQSNSFLLTHLQGCILFKSWPWGLPWQVNRGLCLAARVGTTFMMCKSCIVLVVFIAFTEVVHSFQL